MGGRGEAGGGDSKDLWGWCRECAEGIEERVCDEVGWGYGEAFGEDEFRCAALVSWLVWLDWGEVREEGRWTYRR